MDELVASQQVAVSSAPAFVNVTPQVPVGVGRCWIDRVGGLRDGDRIRGGDWVRDWVRELGDGVVLSIVDRLWRSLRALCVDACAGRVEETVKVVRRCPLWEAATSARGAEVPILLVLGTPTCVSDKHTHTYTV